MALYGIADLHLSLGTDKPMDIFGGWDNYVERLENNWRNLVNEEDTVVIAGDVSWAMALKDTVLDKRPEQLSLEDFIELTKKVELALAK